MKTHYHLQEAETAGHSHENGLADHEHFAEGLRRHARSEWEFELDRQAKAAGLVACGRPPAIYMGDRAFLVGRRKVFVFLNGCYWHQCPHCYPPIEREAEVMALFGQPFDAQKEGALAEVDRHCAFLGKLGKTQEAARLALLVKKTGWYNRTLRQPETHRHTCIVWECQVKARGWGWLPEAILAA